MDMWTLISTALTATGVRKTLPYIIVGLTAMGILVAAYMQGRAAASQKQTNKALTDSLSRFNREAKARAEIESVNASVARKQLRKRWSSN